MNGNNNGSLRDLIKQLKSLGTEQTLGIAKILEEIEADKKSSSPQTLYQGSKSSRERNAYAAFFELPSCNLARNETLELQGEIDNLAFPEPVLYPCRSGWLSVYTGSSSSPPRMRRGDFEVFDGGKSDSPYKP